MKGPKKAPPPTKSERKRADAKRETKTSYTNTHGERVTVEAHAACAAKGCDECNQWGFVRV